MIATYFENSSLTQTIRKMFNFVRRLPVVLLNKTMQHPVKVRVLLLLLPLSYSCQNEQETNSYSDCRYEAPQAVFSDELPTVSSHHFVLRQEAAEEEIAFEDGVGLTLRQSGCEVIRQEYHFSIPQQLKEADRAFWISLTGTLLRRLAELGPEYLVYSSWARSIEAAGDRFQTGVSLEVQPGFFFQLDHHLHADRTTVVVIFSQEP